MDADTRLVAAHEFFRRGEASAERWSLLIAKDRRWESAYRDRWRHDKVVRSTHGVNCTGSCTWNVYGFILMALVSVACLIVLSALRTSQPAAPSQPAAHPGVQARR